MDKEEIIRSYGSLELAYIGDAAFELAVRRFLLDGADNGDMHRRAKEYVSAHAQNEALSRILPLLSEDEAAVVRRGRNAKSRSHPKNADGAEYHGATAFEALWGYLWLADDAGRLNELFEKVTE